MLPLEVDTFVEMTPLTYYYSIYYNPLYFGLIGEQIMTLVTLQLI